MARPSQPSAQWLRTLGNETTTALLTRGDALEALNTLHNPSTGPPRIVQIRMPPSTDKDSLPAIPEKLPNPPQAGNFYRKEEIIAVVLMRERAGIIKMNTNVDATKAASSIYYPVGEKDFAIIRRHNTLGSAYSREIKKRLGHERTCSKIIELYGYGEVRKIQGMLEARGFKTDTLPYQATPPSTLEEKSLRPMAEDGGTGQRPGNLGFRDKLGNIQRKYAKAKSALDPSGRESRNFRSTKTRDSQPSRAILGKTTSTEVDTASGYQRLRAGEDVVFKEDVDPGISGQVLRLSLGLSENASNLELFKKLQEKCLQHDNGDPNGPLARALLDGINQVVMNPDVPMTILVKTSISILLWMQKGYKEKRAEYPTRRLMKISPLCRLRGAKKSLRAL